MRFSDGAPHWQQKLLEGITVLPCSGQTGAAADETTLDLWGVPAAGRAEGDCRASIYGNGAGTEMGGTRAGHWNSAEMDRRSGSGVEYKEAVRILNWTDMYDDTNWCLACDCRFDGPGPYCALCCDEQPLVDDPDDDAIYRRAFHVPHAQWSGNDPAGIAAWAAQIPHHLPGPPSRARSRSRRLPKLLRPHRRPAPPALGVTLPTAVLPSPAYPISTPRPQSTFCSSLSLQSLGRQSLMSARTDSSLATPASTLPLGVPVTKPSFFGTLATHVRSWVAPSPLVASSPVVSRDYPHLSPIAAKQHETQPNLSLLAQRLFDGPDTAWRLQTTILVADPRSRGRNPART